MLTNRNEHLSQIAAILAEVRDKEHVQRLLIPCTYYPDTAYKMCELLAWLYVEQASAVADVVQRGMEG